MDEIITIPTDLLFFPYKQDLEGYYKKYWRKSGNYLWMGNHPLTVFAEDYLKYGKKILKNLDTHIFIVYEYDRYSTASNVKNDTHKYNASNRIIEMVDSIKKYGYCQNKYNKLRHLIRVKRVVDRIYMPGKEVYVLKSRKHRASACCSLGIKNIKVKAVS